MRRTKGQPKRRRQLKLVPHPDRDREHCVGVLEKALRRIKSGDSGGVLVVERINGDPADYRLGWGGLRQMRELVGYLEEAKHQLLCAHQVQD